MFIANVILQFGGKCFLIRTTHLSHVRNIIFDYNTYLWFLLSIDIITLLHPSFGKKKQLQKMHFCCNKRKIGITNSKSRFQFENQKLILLCKVQRIMLALTKQLQRQKRLLFVLNLIRMLNYHHGKMVETSTNIQLVHSFAATHTIMLSMGIVFGYI